MEGLWGTSPMTLLLSAAVGAIVASAGLLLRRRWGGGRRVPSGEHLATLYHRHTSPTARCVWLLEELGAQDAIVVKTIPSSESGSPDPEQCCRLELKNGAVIRDSVAICLYIAELFQALVPADEEKAHYYNWSISSGSSADPILRELSRQIYVLPDGQKDVDLVTSLTRRHGDFMDELEGHLASRDYVCGNKFTVADIILGYSVVWSDRLKGGQLLVNSPRVRSYLKRLKSRKASTRSLGSTRDWLMSIY